MGSISDIGFDFYDCFRCTNDENAMIKVLDREDNTFSLANIFMYYEENVDGIWESLILSSENGRKKMQFQPYLVALANGANSTKVAKCIRQRLKEIRSDPNWKQPRLPNLSTKDSLRRFCLVKGAICRRLVFHSLPESADRQ